VPASAAARTAGATVAHERSCAGFDSSGSSSGGSSSSSSSSSVSPGARLFPERGALLQGGVQPLLQLLLVRLQQAGAQPRLRQLPLGAAVKRG
jgi:hypothetical protein